MNNEFIPYEKALALKELGFNELCLAYYQKSSVIGDDTILPLIICKDATNWNDYSFSKLGVPFYSAPTYQQAFRWIMQFPQIKKWRCNVALYPDGTYSIKDGKEAIHEFLSGEECLRKLIEIVKENKDE
jgi:hypothetical protein